MLRIHFERLHREQCDKIFWRSLQSYVHPQLSYSFKNQSRLLWGSITEKHLNIRCELPVYVLMRRPDLRKPLRPPFFECPFDLSGSPLEKRPESDELLFRDSKRTSESVSVSETDILLGVTAIKQINNQSAIYRKDDYLNIEKIAYIGWFLLRHHHQAKYNELFFYAQCFYGNRVFGSSSIIPIWVRWCIVQSIDRQWQHTIWTNLKINYVEKTSIEIRNDEKKLTAIRFHIFDERSENIFHPKCFTMALSSRFITNTVSWTIILTNHRVDQSHT